MGEVDGVGANAVAGDDLELRQRGHEHGGGAEVAAGGDGAHLVAVLGKEGVAVGRLPELQDAVAGLHILEVPGGIGAGHQHRGLRHGKSPLRDYPH